MYTLRILLVAVFGSLHVFDAAIRKRYFPKNAVLRNSSYIICSLDTLDTDGHTLFFDWLAVVPRILKVMTSLTIV